MKRLRNVLTRMRPYRTSYSPPQRTHNGRLRKVQRWATEAHMNGWTPFFEREVRYGSRSRDARPMPYLALQRPSKRLNKIVLYGPVGVLEGVAWLDTTINLTDTTPKREGNGLTIQHVRDLDARTGWSVYGPEHK